MSIMHRRLSYIYIVLSWTDRDFTNFNTEPAKPSLRWINGNWCWYLQSGPWSWQTSKPTVIWRVLISIRWTSKPISDNDLPDWIISKFDCWENHEYSTIHAHKFAHTCSASYWSLTIVKEDWNCIIPQGYCTDRITGCTVYFSVCKPLPEGICSNHTNSSTCLVVTTDDNKDHYFNIGSYNARPDHGLVPTGAQFTQSSDFVLFIV